MKSQVFKKTGEKIKRILFDNEEEYTLEQRYTVVLNFLGSIGLLLGYSAVILFGNVMVVLEYSIYVGIFLLCFFLTKSKKFPRFTTWLIVLNILLITNFIWFNFYGSKGASLLVNLILVIWGVSILQNKDKIIGIFVIFTNLFLLVYVEYKFPFLIKTYDNEFERLMHIGIIFCICAFVTITFISTVFNNYKEQRRKTGYAEELNTAFLNNISHELRTPMNAIIGFSELLTSPGGNEPEQTIYLDYIRSSCDGLVSLIDNIINMARIESKQIRIKKTRINVSEVLEQIREHYQNIQPPHETKDIELVLNRKCVEEELCVETDEIFLKKILVSLIDNSLKYTHTGLVEFGAKRQSEKLLFYVKDTGIGISEEHGEVVFNKFIQADIGVNREYGGTGLGLAISKGLVELLGGEIWFESKQGEGTTFYFTIPAIRIRRSRPFSEKRKYTGKFSG